MTEINANVKRLTFATEATFVAGTIRGQWAFATDTKRLLQHAYLSDVIDFGVSDDSLQMLLAGTQTVTGAKTFSAHFIAAANLEVRGQAYSPLNPLVDAATIATNCDLGNVHNVTLAGNRTLGAPTNAQGGATYIWAITQDGTGSRTLAYNAVFKFPGGTAPTLSTTAGAVDILTGVADGVAFYCVLQKDFK